MTTIYATFHQRSHAVAAVNALGQAGFALDAKMPLPIDPDFDVSAQPAVSPGAEESGTTAVKGAAVGATVGVIVGLTLTPLVGPAGAVAGAGVGAYTGSLVGALSGLEAPHNAQEAEAGALLELNVDDPLAQQRAIEILHAHEAVNVTQEPSVSSERV